MMQPEQINYHFGTISLNDYPVDRNINFFTAVYNLDLQGKRSWFDRQASGDIRTVRDREMDLSTLIELVKANPTAATLQIRNNDPGDMCHEIRLHLEGYSADRKIRHSGWIECPLTPANYKLLQESFTASHGHTLGS